MGASEETLVKEKENLILETEESYKDTIEEILELYVLCVNDIKKELRSFITTYGNKGILSYTETKRFLTASERKDFNIELKSWYKYARDNNLDSSYISFLESLGKKKNITRMEYLQAIVRNDIEKMFFTIEDKMRTKFRDIYMYSYYTDSYIINKYLKTGEPLIELTEKDIENALNGRYANSSLNTSLSSNKKKLISDFQTSIPQGFARGFSVKKLEDLVDVKMRTSINRNIALTRTETNYLSNRATLMFYKDINVDKYQYIATLDMRTSDMCRDMDGYIGLVSEAVQGVNFPPIHVNCRSTTVPYIEKYYKDGERVARDENGKSILVPRKMTQEEYIKTYVPEKYRNRLLKFKNSYRPKIEQK